MSPTNPIYCPECEAANDHDAVVCSLCSHELVRRAVRPLRSAKGNGPIARMKQPFIQRLQGADAKSRKMLSREVGVLWVGGAIVRILGWLCVLGGSVAWVLGARADNMNLAWVGGYAVGAGLSCVLLGTTYRAIAGIWAALLK